MSQKIKPIKEIKVGIAPKNITIITFGYQGLQLPELIMKDVEHEFSLPVIVQEGHVDLSEFYDASRRQYNANKILQKIESDYAGDTYKTLAVFNVDLFIPILTYIFGQAMLNGRTGIASIHRLSNELYGMPKDNNLLLNRFRKEVIHELGHTFGLIHCQDTTCVMKSSTYVEDIDQKGYKLCNKCKRELGMIL